MLGALSLNRGQKAVRLLLAPESPFFGEVLDRILILKK
jgi:hypothetical protein